jgi:hypothetical protein
LPKCASLHEVPWERAINASLTRCTYADILLGLTDALLNKHEYISVKYWVDHKVFPRELNSLSCVLHDGAHVVTSATYEYVPLTCICDI